MGIRASQLRSIQLKRDAPNIQDSITAVNIGQLPDVTIADSLQRITGVQVEQAAGEGTTVNINGLPEVQTLINGHEFLGANNISDIQPNYEDLPSELFSGANVLKTPLATLPAAGISGTIDLRTRHPWDLPSGWTFAGNAEGGWGSDSRKVKPNVSALFAYNAHGKWGALLDLSYSDFIHSYGSQGWGSSGAIFGENSSSANEDGLGFLAGWSGLPPPSQVHVLPTGDVDVNGDGKSNGAFFIPTRASDMNQIVNPKREGANASFQAQLGDSFTLTADGFYTHEVLLNEQTGMQTSPIATAAGTTLPLLTTEQSGTVLQNGVNQPGLQSGNWNQTFFTTQGYNIWYGDIMSEMSANRAVNISRNFNVDLHFDNGGPFTGDLSWTTATAAQQSSTMNLEGTTTNGSEWPNTLAPGVTLPSTVYPVASGSGTAPLNPDGIGPAYQFAVGSDWSGKNVVYTMPPDVAQALVSPNTYRLKGVFGLNYVNAHSGMNNLNAEGKYAFSDDLNIQFGFRNSLRSARLTTLVPVAPVYAGEGASDPNGCMVRWLTADTVMDGQGVAGACTAGNAYGAYRGNKYATVPIDQLPSILSNNFIRYNNPGGVQGLDMMGFNAAGFTNPFAAFSSLYPGAVLNMDPGDSWDVFLKTRTFFAQANFKGDIAGHAIAGNFGARVVNTDLGVTQNLTGAATAYGEESELAGQVRTNRSYTDILPAFNVAINLTDNLIWRLAASKNMMPLTLAEWGGGFTPTYQFTTLPNGRSVFAIITASSSGNPNLNPWRSRNYYTSLEYYIGKDSIVSLSGFYTDVASFVQAGGVQDCTLPDEDGVVRNRCVPVSSVVQGSGAALRGISADWSQGFEFLPSFLSHTGVGINVTYSPSSTDQVDMAGSAVPFPGNSKKSGNLILWYQDSKLQARIALNYRSKEAVQADSFGIQGFEEYEAAQRYVDASVSYQITPNFQLYLQGQNLNNERQHLYFVWPDQKWQDNLSERYVMLGVHARF
jgi:TonB-dependent receptor